MNRYNVYIEIHQVREAGFSQRTIAITLGISRKTISRYWDMNVDKYERSAQKIIRIRHLDIHREQMASWLREYPILTAAQGCNWLKEYYWEVYAERSTASPDIAIWKAMRPWTSLPWGSRCRCISVNVPSKCGRRLDEGIRSLILSYSYYKYAQCQSKPFTASDLVAACHNCFRYWGCMPREMAFEQDCIIWVSENGEKLFTPMNWRSPARTAGWKFTYFVQRFAWRLQMVICALSTYVETFFESTGSAPESTSPSKIKTFTRQNHRPLSAPKQPG